MKVFLTLVLLTVCTVAFSQATQQKQDTTTQQVIVKLTEWQEKQLQALEQQRKIIEEQSKLLVATILDANNVKEGTVAKFGYRPGEFVLRVRKKE